MIRIKFKEPITAIWKRWINDCEKATTEIEDAYEKKKEIEVSDLYKRKSIKDSVFFAKDGPFKGRCAYCDSYIRDFQHGEIEHFRPKKGVTDENDKPITIGESDGKDVYHPGYYWLAYSWKNLLPSCITCNQPGQEGIGKRNRFPVEGGRYAIRKEDVPSERPLLFNPIDHDDQDPEQHLGIDLNTGLMAPKDESPRGQACIKIFGLNIRDQLVQERVNAVSDTKVSLIELATGNDEMIRKALDDIARMKDGYLNQTLARRAQIQKMKERFEQI